MTKRLQPILLRLYRAGVLVAIAWLMHQQQQWFKAQREATLTVAQVQDFFATAISLGAAEPQTSLQEVLDATEQKLGYVMQTAPLSDGILGYSGPTNTLIALDAQRKVLGLRVLHSEDTVDHLAEVIRDRRFFAQFKELVYGGPPADFEVDAVSGATLTSTAIAEGVLQRLGQQGTSLRFPEEITLDEVKAIEPQASSLGIKDQPKPGLQEVLDASGKRIAAVTRTSPVSDSIIGYKGPSDSLIVLDAGGEKVLSVELRKSYDTRKYVGYITGDAYFKSLFKDLTLEQLGALDFKATKIEGVSGATETSWVMAEGLKRKAASLAAAQAKSAAGFSLKLTPADWGLLVVLGVSLLMTFTGLRGQGWVRWLHHVLLIGYVGLFCGAMLSQGMLVGWAQHGIPWQNAPLLVLLTALALALPLFSRRQFYCHHYCPHGALQQVMANRLPWQLKISPRWNKLLEKLPWLLLIFIVIVVMLGLETNLNALEPFDAWLIRVAGWGTITVAVVSVIASLFVPMAYCRYGCPTGAVFKFLRYAGHADHFGRRDGFALLLVIGACIIGYVARS
jgi:NosR/NirI family transcriptional regulator, nitrous oxide reductase regulator